MRSVELQIAVLIETLWNVKRNQHSVSGLQLRINRNIMECKV